MAVKVKICGIKTPEALQAALAARADLVGFVFYPPSPRSLAPEVAAELVELARGQATIVALIVDADDAQIERIVQTVNPDMLQLHGSETPERVIEITRRWGKSVIKAIKVETAADAAQALAYVGIARLVLFDAKAPKDLAGALPGGNGLAFDWHLLDGVKDRVPYMLSGGLTPENVGAAITATGATIVDVSSGVETAPGIKSPDLIRRFIDAARAVHAPA
ncbi:MAG: phosphoribosylanthranilate isomerase [Hyphomicrobium sp.]|nr:phosphoribosylanthranilate isomerase [Hyphomicrobium sp.]